MKNKKDKSLAASVPAGSESALRGRWTIDEIIELAKTAIDNSLDYASADEPAAKFQVEFEFQLLAPEHRGRPTPTPAQLAVALAIWNADERTGPPISASQMNSNPSTRTTHPNPADKPNSTTKES